MADDLVRRMTITDVKPSDPPYTHEVHMQYLNGLMERNAIEQERKAMAGLSGEDRNWQAAKQQGYSGGSALNQQNPESIPNRLNQLIYGLNGNLHSANLIMSKLFGPRPETPPDNIKSMEEPPVNIQLNMLQNKTTELQGILEGILKEF